MTKFCKKKSSHTYKGSDPSLTVISDKNHLYKTENWAVTMYSILWKPMISGKSIFLRPYFSKHFLEYYSDVFLRRVIRSRVSHLRNIMYFSNWTLKSQYAWTSRWLIFWIVKSLNMRLIFLAREYHEWCILKILLESNILHRW